MTQVLSDLTNTCMYVFNQLHSRNIIRYEVSLKAVE